MVVTIPTQEMTLQYLWYDMTHLYQRKLYPKYLEIGNYFTTFLFQATYSAEAQPTLLQESTAKVTL